MALSQKEVVMERKIGVSVASLLPWSLGKDGIYKSIEIAVEKSGFNGLQILPMRRWQAEETLGDWVISFEDAWNSGSFFGAIEREIYQFVTRKKCAMEEKPRFYDWFLFGNREEACDIAYHFRQEFWRAIYISNEWPSYSAKADYNAIELCPEMFPMRKQNIFDQICAISNIAFDTEHVTRKGRHGEPPIAECWKWRDLIELIEPERIKLIHVKPHFPAGSELPQMLATLAKKTKDTMCPVILEAKPIFRSKKKTIDWLKEHLDFLRMHFD